MKALKVKDLYEEMKERVENGQGDFVVFVTNDEEGNGYHALWYKGNTPDFWADAIRENVEESLNCDIDLIKDNKDKAVYIG